MVDFLDKRAVSAAPPAPVADGDGPRVGMVSLGCPKNLVDSETLMGRLAGAGFVPTADPAEAEVLIVNTCGFIDKAKEESIDQLLEMAQYKEEGRCRYLVGTGCLTQRYAKELSVSMPEVDAWLGFEAYGEIDKVLWELYGGRLDGVPVRVSDPGKTIELERARLRLTPAHYAYLRISEGCDKTCTFCTIPSFRGGFRSKPMQACVEEAAELVASGARELNVISQDTLQYGTDLADTTITEMLARVADTPGLDWLRLWYLYPGRMPAGLIELVNEHPRIVPYLDMPIQHGDAGVLAAMRRPSNVDAMRAQLLGFRESIPGLALRTSVIVGFPGETDQAFESMLGLVREIAFDRLGVFVYSQEEGTPAGEMDDQIPEELKLERHARVVEVASEIQAASQSARIGSETDVLIDGPARDVPDMLSGRSPHEGPEVDPLVLLPEGSGEPGAMVRVRLTELRGLDLVGERL